MTKNDLADFGIIVGAIATPIIATHLVGIKPVLITAGILAVVTCYAACVSASRADKWEELSRRHTYHN
jgi:hypothetical protein